MTETERRNRFTMSRWYEDMWGKCDASIIPELLGETVLRHDTTGANRVFEATLYEQLIGQSFSGNDVTDFGYFLVAEGDYVAALGRSLRTGQEQWDWVQMFRLDDGRIVETWLPGMGGGETRAYPKIENAWIGVEIPAETDLPKSKQRETVQKWFEGIASGNMREDLFVSAIRWHDLKDADITLDAASLRTRMRSLMQNDDAKDLQLLLIESGDMVVATGRWILGGHQRSWDWVQAFRLQDNKIAESWLTSIGGTDTSIKQSPDVLWNFDVLPQGSVRFGASVSAP